MSQWYCSVAGQQFGPASEDQLKQWIQEGRINPTDHVRAEDWPEWKMLQDVPHLVAGAGGQPAPIPQPPPVLQPHRGTAVLVLGILGIVVCFICGIIAWSMGNRDLRRMDAGIMDPAGRDTTRAGKICGMIGTILALVLFGLWLVGTCIAAASLHSTR